jgi:hypothetical protein
MGSVDGDGEGLQAGEAANFGCMSSYMFELGALISVSGCVLLIIGGMHVGEFVSFFPFFDKNPAFSSACFSVLELIFFLAYGARFIFSRYW